MLTVCQADLYKISYCIMPFYHASYFFFKKVLGKLLLLRCIMQTLSWQDVKQIPWYQGQAHGNDNDLLIMLNILKYILWINITWQWYINEQPLLNNKHLTEKKIIWIVTHKNANHSSRQLTWNIMPFSLRILIKNLKCHLQQFIMAL